MQDIGIERGRGIAIWRQIAEALRGDIERKGFDAVGRLPTEAELSQRFGVNRHTIRRAMAQLEEEGLVRIEQGRGTFLQGGMVDYRLGARTRFSENIRAMHMRPSGEVLRSLEQPADGAVAQALSLRRGAPVYLIELKRYVDDRPLSVGSHFFSARRLPDLLKAFTATESVTEALKQCGVEDYRRKSTRITARLPDAYEIRELAIPRTRPVLITEAVDVDSDERPIEYGLARMAADRVQLVVEN